MEKIGKYEVIRKLGEGATSTLFPAPPPGGLGGPPPVKSPPGKGGALWGGPQKGARTP